MLSNWKPFGGSETGAVVRKRANSAIIVCSEKSRVHTRRYARLAMAKLRDYTGPFRAKRPLPIRNQFNREENRGGSRSLLVNPASQPGPSQNPQRSAAIFHAGYHQTSQRLQRKLRAAV